MDIYTAISHSERLFNFISDYCTDEKNIYQPTKDKLNTISEQCSTIHSMVDSFISGEKNSTISTMSSGVSYAYQLNQFLQDMCMCPGSYIDDMTDQIEIIRKLAISIVNVTSDMLGIGDNIQFDDIYRGNSIDKKLNQALSLLNDINSQISSHPNAQDENAKDFQEFSHLTDNFTDTDENIEPTCGESESLFNIGCETVEMGKNILSSEQKKQVYAAYCEEMLELEYKNIPYTHINRCRSLINKWWDIRMIKEDKSFFYDIRKVESWIYAIVLGYVHAKENDYLHRYETQFYEWLKDVNTSDKGVPYSLPYKVWSLYDKPEGITSPIFNQIVIVYQVCLSDMFSHIYDKCPYLRRYSKDIFEWADSHNIDCIVNSDDIETQISTYEL